MTGATAILISYSVTGGVWQQSNSMPLSNWSANINSPQCSLLVQADPATGDWLVTIVNHLTVPISGQISLLLSGVGRFASPCRLVSSSGESVSRSITKPAGELSGQRFDSTQPTAPLLDQIRFEVPVGGTAEWRASVAPCEAADLDGDGSVGQGDLSVLLGAWGSSAKAADLDDDGIVDADDLAQFLGQWPS